MSLKVSTCLIQRGVAPQWQFVNYFMQVPLNYVGAFVVGRNQSSASRRGKLSGVEVKSFFCFALGLACASGVAAASCTLLLFVCELVFARDDGSPDSLFARVGEKRS